MNKPKKYMPKQYTVASLAILGVLYAAATVSATPVRGLIRDFVAFATSTKTPAPSASVRNEVVPSENASASTDFPITVIPDPSPAPAERAPSSSLADYSAASDQQRDRDPIGHEQYASTHSSGGQLSDSSTHATGLLALNYPDAQSVLAPNPARSNPGIPTDTSPLALNKPDGQPAPTPKQVSANPSKPTEKSDDSPSDRKKNSVNATDKIDTPVLDQPDDKKKHENGKPAEDLRPILPVTLDPALNNAGPGERYTMPFENVACERNGLSSAPLDCSMSNQGPVNPIIRVSDERVIQAVPEPTALALLGLGLAGLGLSRRRRI